MPMAMKPLRLLVIVVATAIAILALAVVANTALSPSRQLQVAAVEPADVDAAGATGRLSAAIRKKTIASATDPGQNLDQFLALHEQLASDYPRVHAALKKEVVNGTALLFTWEGSDPAAPAIVLMAHMDVVPVAPGTEGDWQAPPFDGVVKAGFVWGRGAWDDKGNLIAQLDAVEALLATGFKPGRTIYLSYGADEEVDGRRGAGAIAKRLEARGVRAGFVLDEGMLITEDMIAGLDAPAAIVGIAEKGYLSVTLGVSAQPGHSSMPPTDKSGAVTELSEVLLRLRDHEMPVRMSGVAGQMFDTLGPEMHGMSRVALTNLWLFSPMVKAQLSSSPSTNAILRTTTAFTMLSAGNKDNVLPGRAEATLNFRLQAGDGSDAVLEHIRQQARAVVPADRFTVTRQPLGNEASPVSPTGTEGYRMIERTMRELEPRTLVAPGLMLAATDSRYFTGVSDNIYRFSPIHAKPEDLSRFHGTNERLSVADLANMIRFYRRLIELSAGKRQ